MATVKSTETQTLTNYEIWFQRTTTAEKKICFSMRDTMNSQLSSWSEEKWSSKNLREISDHLLLENSFMHAYTQAHIHSTYFEYIKK